MPSRASARVRSAANQRPPVSRQTATASSAIARRQRGGQRRDPGVHLRLGQQDLERDRSGRSSPAGGSLAPARRRRGGWRQGRRGRGRRGVGGVAGGGAALAAGAVGGRAAQRDARRPRDVGAALLLPRSARRPGAASGEVDLHRSLAGERRIEDRGAEAGASAPGGMRGVGETGDLTGHTLALGVEQTDPQRRRDHRAVHDVADRRPRPPASRGRPPAKARRAPARSPGRSGSPAGRPRRRPTRSAARRGPRLRGTRSTTPSTTATTIAAPAQSAPLIAAWRIALLFLGPVAEGAGQSSPVSGARLGGRRRRPARLASAPSPSDGDQLQRTLRMRRPARAAGGAAHRAARRPDLAILDEIAGGALRTGQYHDKPNRTPEQTFVEVADFGSHVQEAHRPAIEPSGRELAAVGRPLRGRLDALRPRARGAEGHFLRAARAARSISSPARRARASRRC